mmetsp:Transcript_35242/g.112654  ORF Transcript_35242/g.112654 Transcript_35242/m.112654 type:complete len:208 (+) Transcript_35242:1544-2167(+)
MIPATGRCAGAPSAVSPAATLCSSDAKAPASTLRLPWWPSAPRPLHAKTIAHRGRGGGAAAAAECVTGARWRLCARCATVAASGAGFPPVVVRWKLLSRTSATSPEAAETGLTPYLAQVGAGAHASKSDGSVALVNCGRASSAVPLAAENRSSRALTATAPSAAAAEEEEPSELALRRGARNATTSATPPARAKPASPREDCSTAPV